MWFDLSLAHAKDPSALPIFEKKPLYLPQCRVELVAWLPLPWYLMNYCPVIIILKYLRNQAIINLQAQTSDLAIQFRIKKTHTPLL